MIAVFSVGCFLGLHIQQADAQRVKSARTVFSKSWNRWNVRMGRKNVRLRTVFSKSWNRWRINDRLKGIPAPARLAAIFPCIMSGPIFSKQRRRR